MPDIRNEFSADEEQQMRQARRPSVVPAPSWGTLNTRAGHGLSASDSTPGGFQPIEGPLHRTASEIRRRILGPEDLNPSTQTVEDRINANR